MPDCSPCQFSRTQVAIVVHHNEGFSAQLPEAGMKTLRLELTSDEWAVMSIGEFYSRLIKAKLLGAEFVDIYGENSTQFLRFLNNILPMVELVLPIRVAVDGCRTLFVEKIIKNLSGVCVDIRLPLKESFTREDREQCQNQGEYRTLMQYREQIRKTVELVDHLPLTVYRVLNPEMFREEGLASVIQFLGDCKAPIAIPRITRCV